MDCLEVASAVMSAPVNIGQLRLNVAVFMSVFCTLLTLLSYSGGLAVLGSSLQAHCKLI